MSFVGILPDGQRVELDRVCDDWKSDLLLPADPVEAQECLKAHGERFNAWLGWPSFYKKVAQCLGYEVKTDLIPVEKWSIIHEQFLERVRAKYPEIICNPVYFLSICQDGVVSQGAHSSCSTVSSGFVDAEEFYCAFEFGDVDFYLGNGSDLLTDPRWFYTDQVVSLEEFQSNDFYHSSVYSFTADLALSIIAKYRAGHPGMTPPERQAEIPLRKREGYALASTALSGDQP